MERRAMGLILIVALMWGCSPSAYRVHTTAVVTLAAAHVVASGTYVAARDAALDAVEAAHPVVGDERTAALRIEAARWTPAAAALDAVPPALATWLDSVELALASDTGEGAMLALLVTLAAHVLRLYDAIAVAFRALGIEAPALPAAVLAVVGGAS